MGIYQHSQADAEALRRCLEQNLADASGRPPAITSIGWSRSDRATSFAAGSLTVRLASGHELKLYLKDFGFSRLPKDNLPQRRERELRVYRDLLASSDLVTARYCGSVWDEQQQRFWLLLEWVDGTELRSCDFELWVRAAGWLGRMQGHFAQHPYLVNTSSFLLRHDRDFFRSKAELALSAVSQVSDVLGERLAAALSRYDRAVDVMAGQPHTLVHGSYRPQNILVDLGAEPARICPIDWELAACGAPLYDLAFLSDGFRPPQLDVLWDAYRRQAAAYGIAVPSQPEMAYIIGCFRLHKIIKSLSECVTWRFPARTVAKLVSMSQELSSSLGLLSYAQPGTVVEAKATPALQHPAVAAWSALGLGQARAERVEVLREKRKKCGLYRLAGVGPRRTNVIAKRCPTGPALIERTIYEAVLPHLPVTTPRFYGFIEEDAECSWLFLEDVGSERFSPTSAEQRLLAARWLGALHTAAQVATAGRLPDRGPSYYLDLLRSARATILCNLANPALTAGDIALLERIIAQCDLLELGWGQLEQRCAALPTTLVHGDFRPKNVLVRTGQSGTGLFPIDWESAGYGFPAVDLAPARSLATSYLVEIDAYWSVVQERWTSVDLQTLQQLAPIAWIFRKVAAIYWESQSLAYEWLEKPISCLSIYQAELAYAIQAAMEAVHE